MSTLKTAYHESGHALIARDFGRPLEVVAIGLDGSGITRTATPIAGDRSLEELERALVILFAGEVAQGYAPLAPMSPDAVAHADSNGGPDPYAGVAGLAAMAEHEAEAGPTDDAVLEHYREKLGDEVVERARALAIELIDRKFTTGALERLADELLWRGALSGDELERILDASA